MSVESLDATMTEWTSGAMRKSAKLELPFDPQAFLARIGAGRTIVSCPPGQAAFAQGDPADAIFYIREGKLKLTVVSRQGKEAVVAILTPGAFFGEGCLAGQIKRMA